MRSVILEPFVPPAVQTAPVEVVNVTVRFEEAVADTVIGDCWRFAVGSGPNAIVCAALLTVKVRVIDVAGA